MPEKKVTAGRIVIYVAEINGKIETRPALVIGVVNKMMSAGYTDDVVQLHVFFDGSNDIPNPSTVGAYPFWRTSVPYDETGKTVNTWHWPETAGFVND